MSGRFSCLAGCCLCDYQRRQTETQALAARLDLRGQLRHASQNLTQAGKSSGGHSRAQGCAECQRLDLAPRRIAAEPRRLVRDHQTRLHGRGRSCRPQGRRCRCYLPCARHWWRGVRPEQRQPRQQRQPSRRHLRRASDPQSPKQGQLPLGGTSQRHARRVSMTGRGQTRRL